VDLSRGAGWTYYLTADTNSASLLRLSTAVLQEQHDEWQDGRCHFSQQSMARLDPDNQDRLTNPLTAGLAA
jgi:hypothetical protein